MAVKSEIVDALSQALTELDSDVLAPMPGSVIKALAPLAKPGMELKIDLEAGKLIGAPLVLMKEAKVRPDLFKGLTKRQREVAELVATGKSNRQIAFKLCIATATVKDHVHAILSRLDISSRTELIALVHKSASE